MNRRNWSRKELIVAFNLYLKLPFGKLDQNTPEVIELARNIGRSPSAVAMRLSNFAHIDPYHQERGIKGLSGGKKQVQPIWDEFNNNREELIFESEKILAGFENNSIERKYQQELFGIDELEGKEQIREVKTRVNQSFFRQMVLANYSGKCAISGIDISDFLLASHIVPWSKNEKERLNPENGICLSALYDLAYDKGFIGISENYNVLISKELKKKSNESYYENYFSPIEGMEINRPKKYLPRADFLQFHLDSIFKG